MALATVGACDNAADRAAESQSTPHFDVRTCIDGVDAPIQVPVGACLASPAKTFALVMEKTGALDVEPVTPRGELGAPTWTTGREMPKNARM